jgi:hypothetical protein
MTMDNAIIILRPGDFWNNGYHPAGSPTGPDNKVLDQPIPLATPCSGGHDCLAPLLVARLSLRQLLRNNGRLMTKTMTPLETGL